MIRYARLWAAFFRNCITREMEYRGHFFMQFIVDMVWYGVQVALFEVIYLNTSSIAGMSYGEMAVFLGTLFITDAVNEMLFSSNFVRFPRLIAAGELDFYIIRPVSTFFISLTRYIRLSSWLNLAVGIGVLLYGIVKAGLVLSVGDIALFLLLAACGVVVMLSMQGIVMAIAVLMVQADGIQHVYYSVYQLGMKPDAIYSRWIRRILLSVFPLAFIASVPAQVLLGKLTPELLLCVVVVVPSMLAISTWVFRRALRQYSGASA